MDKYYVYRPLLDLIQKFEGTLPGRHPKARGYNTTLDYDAYTGGPVELVKMTLKQVDDLQTKMLAHAKNKWNSSAAGAYQIVRTTKRGIEAKLKLDKNLLYNEDMQDRMACFLLGQRGVDKWLSGRLSEDTLLTNLSAEWASFPKPDGKGTYPGQGVGGKVSEVRAALAEVKRRHKEQQPANIPPELDKEVKKEVREKSGWLGGIFGTSGLGLGSLALFKDFSWETVAALFAGGIVTGILVLLIGEWAISRFQAIRRKAEE